MAAKKDYAVGRGKPPVHSRFEKGQSGNPGGKPGKVKTFEQRMRAAVETALNTGIYSLVLADTKDSFTNMVNQLVIDAAGGNAQARKFLFELIQKYDAADQKPVAEKASAPIATITGAAQEGEPQGVTLSQGKTQGSFEDQPSGDDKSQSSEALSSTDANGSGNGSGTVEPPPVAPRPKRPTITIAGEVVQQGD